MRVLIIAALCAAAAPASGFELTDNVSRSTGTLAPGLQYTVTGNDGATVTVIEGQPRWTTQRRMDSGLAPQPDIGAIVNVIQDFGRHRHYRHY